MSNQMNSPNSLKRFCQKGSCPKGPVDSSSRSKMPARWNVPARKDGGLCPQQGQLPSAVEIHCGPLNAEVEHRYSGKHLPFRAPIMPETATYARRVTPEEACGQPGEL